MSNVPQRERERVNPYRGQPDALAAGRLIFLDHCAKCHGKDADGTKKRPSLKTTRVQQEATDEGSSLVAGEREPQPGHAIVD